MTAHAPEPLTARPVAKESEFPLPQEIDYSCRTPVAFMLLSSVLWLVISLVFGILAAIKMHAPGMFAHESFLTYGRIAAVTSSSFVYGFASQAAIACALWLFARMGRTFLVLPRASFIASLLWNFGVLCGVLGIMTGAMTQFPIYEMPPWTSWMFLVAFVVLGLAGTLTFVARNERDLYPSNWFLFAAFFTFPWVLSVAYVLLGRYNIRPVMEPVVATWFANNFLNLWLAPIAIAILFYFISKLSEQPLYSYSMAAFSFWFYLLAATPSGFQNKAGLPNWMPTLSAVANTLMLLPVVVIAINWYRTWAGHNKAQKAKDRATKYVVFSAAAFFISVLLNLALSCPAIDEVVGLTIFQKGVATWFLYAFIGMALFAAIHHILPRLSEVDWPSPAMTGFHYGLTVVGILITVVALLLGGYVQGNAINNPQIPFSGREGVVRQVVPYIGMSTAGLVVLLAGQVALLANILLMFKSSVFACCGFGTRKEVVR
jgi:cytochrome c oxidase cbb3-type subunit 1